MSSCGFRTESTVKEGFSEGALEGGGGLAEGVQIALLESMTPQVCALVTTHDCLTGQPM